MYGFIGCGVAAAGFPMQPPWNPILGVYLSPIISKR
jgi:hypothetical protein